MAKKRKQTKAPEDPYFWIDGEGKLSNRRVVWFPLYNFNDEVRARSALKHLLAQPPAEVRRYTDLRVRAPGEPRDIPCPAKRGGVPCRFQKGHEEGHKPIRLPGEATSVLELPAQTRSERRNKDRKGTKAPKKDRGSEGLSKPSEGRPRKRPAQKG